MNKSEQISEMMAKAYIDKNGIQGFMGASIETLLTINGNILIYKYIRDSKFFGFSASGKGKTFIVLNTYQNLRRRYYTCAHEMWHVLKEKEVFKVEDIDQERAADHFAASLMLPESAVIEMYNTLKKSATNQLLILFAIADASHMPYLAVERRFSELNLKRNEISKFISSAKEKYSSLDGEKRSEAEYIEEEFIELRSKFGLSPSEDDRVDKFDSFPAYERIINRDSV